MHDNRPGEDDDDAGRAVRGGSGVCEQGEINMSKKVDLTRRKVLGGLASIGAASAAAGAGTMAYFSDTEKSSNNTVSAGTLDLEFDSSGATSLAVSNAKPGDQGYTVIKLNNKGSIAGNLDVNVGSVDSNGVFTASVASTSEDAGGDGDDGVESEGNTATSDGGELEENMNVEGHIEAPSDISKSQGTYSDDFSPSSNSDSFLTSTTLNNAVGEYSTSSSINGGNSKFLIVEWDIPTTVGNTIQDDSVTFDVQVELNQTETSA